MSFDKFCARCGKSTESIIGGVCSKCFLERHDLFEVKDIEIERCVKCGKIHFKGKWTSISNEEIANEVSSKIKLNHELDQPKIFVELEPITELDFAAKVTVTGFIKGVLVEQTKQTEFSLFKVSCDSCMKLVSNYREAIIQLRAGSQSEADSMLEVTKQLLKAESAKDALSAAIRVLSAKNSYDLWIASNKGAIKAARKLSKLYKSKLIVSKKLIGETDEKKLKYRFTYCIKKG
ncbi:MAG: 60S ribosomal export protein NMD3 [archaeon]|jgi:NMD protein affecting ribosome stability and mRNA decay